MIPASSLDEGRRRIGELIVRTSPLGALSNEAETRFHFLDALLIECLGWDRSVIHVEQHQDGEYADYELGRPRSMIVEAKKAGLPFDIPVQARRLLQPIPALFEVDSQLKQAVEQCQEYCVRRGVQYAVVCNGHQLIAFLASRTDGVPPLKAKALVVSGEAQLVGSFNVLWQHLSPIAVEERRLTHLLSSSLGAGLPRKLSSHLLEYPKTRYRNNAQDDLRTVADLLLEDVTTAPEIEPEFYRQCYCESGALSGFAVLSKQIIAARYASLFDGRESGSHLSPVPEAGSGSTLGEDDIVAHALSKRPIVLIGDVGVGKTSFLRNLIFVRAASEFSNSLYVYIDLGSQGALEADLKTFVLNQIDRQLLDRYAIDVRESAFVRGVYDLEVKRFRSGIWGEFYEKDRPRYDEKLLEFLETSLKNTAAHLQQAIRHISRARGRTVIFILDNADQRGLDVQQDAFLIAQNLAKEWDAVVFIAVRPQTFHQSKRAGALSAYPPKVFTISPPRPELLVERRLVFALNMAEGRLPVERLEGIRLNLKGLALFIKALLLSLKRNNEILELLSNITGGNMRAVVELITRFISTPNVDSDKIISTMEKSGHYYIPLHEFSKVAILGDYAHYDPKSSIAMNVFDVSFPDEREHFLSLMILGFLDYDGSQRSLEGFIRSDAIVSEMQNWAYLPVQTSSCLRRLTNKRMIEATERVTFEEDAVGQLIGDMPSAFRITSVGAYHLKRWVGTFGYLDAMAFDTPIFREDFVRDASKGLSSFGLVERYARTTAFRKYLDTAWTEANLGAPYLDWQVCRSQGDASFDAVETAIHRLGRTPNDRG